ncbi:MAG TPA: NAD(P)-dependent oxidoreductase [Microlunatus sp.]
MAAITSQTPRTVLVTGASGLIGRAVVDRLRERGDRVLALDRQPPTSNRLPAEAVLQVAGDCRVETDVERAFAAAEAYDGVDQVVHLAALPHMSAGTPIEVFGTNVVSTFTVLAVAARHGVGRSVIASSIHATGLLGHHRQPLPDRFPLDEEQSAHLDDWYSLSKNVDERSAAMVASRWDMSVIALRFPLVQPLSGLRRSADSYDQDPARAMREGWTYLEDVEAARAVTCALDARSSGVRVLHVAAPDTLLSIDTEAALDRYAPNVPRTRSFVGNEAPMDTSPARDVIGFTARSRFDSTHQLEHSR